MSERPKVFGQLMTEVIRKQLCVSCGTCEASCPVASIRLEDGTPKLIGLCIACGICYNSCPRSAFDEEKLEMQIFGRNRNQEEAELGVYRGYHAVRARDADVLKHCQDGGAVSAILTQFLGGGGDCAVVAGLEKDKLWAPRPIVALNKDDIIGCAGTKYTSSPTLLGVDSAVNEYKLRRVAVVGTPCQMRAMRRIETSVYSNVKISEVITLRIGLFCMETFDQNSFIEFLKKEGVDPSKVTKFAIAKGRFIAYQDSETLYDVKLSKVKEMVRPCCEVCRDFASEFSDISVGNVGSPDGWSTVIVRTEKGEEALRAAENGGLVEVKPLEEGKTGIEAVIRLARMKKKKDEKTGS